MYVCKGEDGILCPLFTLRCVTSTHILAEAGVHISYNIKHQGNMLWWDFLCVFGIRVFFLVHLIYIYIWIHNNKWMYLIRLSVHLYHTDSHCSWLIKRAVFRLVQLTSLLPAYTTTPRWPNRKCINATDPPSSTSVLWQRWTRWEVRNGNRSARAPNLQNVS